MDTSEGTEAMTRSHVTMISMGKHSCVADATSNKTNFSTKDASTKRHPWKMRTRRDGRPGGRSALQAVTFSGARVCTDVPGVFEQMRTRRRRYTRPRDIRGPVVKWHERRLQVRAYEVLRVEKQTDPHRPLNWRRFPAGYRCSISRLETGERLQTLSRSKLLHVA